MLCRPSVQDTVREQEESEMQAERCQKFEVGGHDSAGVAPTTPWDLPGKTKTQRPEPEAGTPSPERLWREGRGRVKSLPPAPLLDPPPPFSPGKVWAMGKKRAPEKKQGLAGRTSHDFAPSIEGVLALAGGPTMAPGSDPAFADSLWARGR